jgi:parvulin-like peptidyl-prolyl isomerase
MPRYRFALAAAVLLASASVRGVLLDRIVATVDGRAITLSELDHAMVTGSLERSAGEKDDAYRERVLSEMIDEYLRYRDALRFSPALPDPAEVDAAVATLRDRLRKEGKDPDSEFRAAGLDAAQVRAALERQIVVMRYVRDRFAGLVFVSPEDLDQEYAGVSEEYRKTGRVAPPRDALDEELRARVRDRRTSEEIDKWTRELREKARITRLAPAPKPAAGTPTVLSKTPS